MRCKAKKAQPARVVNCNVRKRAREGAIQKLNVIISSMGDDPGFEDQHNAMSDKRDALAAKRKSLFFPGEAPGTAGQSYQEPNGPC